jgi:hypothetical protein
LNHYLGVPGALVPGGSQTGSGKLGGKLTQHEAILELFSGKVLQWAEAFLGVGAVNSSSLNAQIAMRFPELEGGPLTDNCIWHTDGFRQGHTHGFRSSAFRLNHFSETIHFDYIYSNLVFSWVLCYLMFQRKTLEICACGLECMK